MRCFLHNSFLNLDFHHDSGIFSVTWKKGAGLTQAKEAYFYILEQAINLKAGKILLNLTARDPQNNLQQWVINNIFPRILAASDKCVFVAVVVPPQEFENIPEVINAEAFMNEDRFLVMQQFLLPEEGLRWLKDQEGPLAEATESYLLNLTEG